MNIIFFGSSEFAVPILEMLSETEDIPLVVTQPDRKKGRNLRVSYTAVKESALRLGIEVFQPPKVNSIEAVEYLKRFNADMFIVVSFGQILSKEVLSVPKIFCINVHASLLPKYRGAAPINWALYNAEKETGVTIIKMNEKMDEGDVILQQKINIGDHDDASMLSKRLSEKGAKALKEAIELTNANKLNLLTQDASKVTYAPKLKKEHGLIDWNSPAQEIYNKVRAFVPWPGCFTYLGNKVIKIWKVTVSDSTDRKALSDDSSLRGAIATKQSQNKDCGSTPLTILSERSESKDFAPSGLAMTAGQTRDSTKHGTIANLSKDGIIVSTGKGNINILELQSEGKRRMQAIEFIAGHREVSVGTVLGRKD